MTGIDIHRTVADDASKLMETNRYYSLPEVYHSAISEKGKQAIRIDYIRLKTSEV